MGKNELKITSDVSELKNGLAQAQAEIIKLRDRLREATQESKKGHAATIGDLNVVGRATADVTGKLRSMALEYTSIAGVIGVVSSAYATWYEKMEQLYTKVKERNAELRSSLMATGRIAEGPQIREAIEGISNDLDVRREKVQAAFSGVITDAPDLSTQRALQVAGESSRAAGVLDDNGLSAISRRAGRMASVFSGKSANDILDLVHASQARVGPEKSAVLDSREYMAAIGALTESGAMTPEQAMGFGNALMNKELPVSILERMSTKVIGTMAQKKAAYGQRLSAEDAAWNRIAKLATPTERIDALLEDDEAAKAVLGERVSGRMGRVRRSDIDTEAQILSNAERTDAFRTALSTPMAAEGKKGEARAQKIDRMDAEMEPRAKALMDAWAEKEMEIRKTSGGYNLDYYLNVAVERALLSTKDAFGFGPGAEVELKRLNEKLSTNQATNAATVSRINGSEGGR